MRSLLAGSILSLAVALAGCIEHRPPERKLVKEPEGVWKGAVRNRLKGLRVYEGVIPCVDCSGIYQRLALKGDTMGIFRLTETYRDATEDGDGVIVTTGSWKRYTDKKNDQPKTILYLSEGTFRDSSRIQRYTLFDKKIVQIDLNGDSINSTGDYVLKLIKKSDN